MLANRLIATLKKVKTSINMVCNARNLWNKKLGGFK